MSAFNFRNQSSTLEGGNGWLTLDKNISPVLPIKFRQKGPIPIFSKVPLWLELIVLFILVPIALALPMKAEVKIGLVVSAVLYSIVMSWRLQLFSRDHLFRFKDAFQNESRPLLLRLFIVCVLALGLMFITDPNNLFIVVRKNPLMWISIALFYSIFSVYPQEFLYRLFFFERYQSLFKSRRIFLLVNTAVFSLAHLMFWNGLVMLLTLLGGLLFARNYERTKSLTFVSLEHALYGVWLFTIGMGEMLAFPMPKG